MSAPLAGILNNPGQVHWGLPIVADFETYYDQDYSLSKITTERYIRGKEFEMIGCSLKVGSEPTRFYRGEEVIPVLRRLVKSFPNQPFASHNSLFDQAILGLRYGIQPNLTVDTAVMAKLCGLDRVAGGASLAKLSAKLEEMGVVQTVKGTTVHDMKGVHMADMTEAQWQAYSEYCKLDSDLCYALYMYCLPLVPQEELFMASLTTRMFTEPAFELDVPLLRQYAVKLEEDKQAMLSNLSVTLGFATSAELHKHLRSSAKFTALLERLGVDVPVKWSEKKQCAIPAVSKTDTEFLELLEHENPLVQAVVEAKLGAQSSQEQTRTATFLDIASRGKMPVPLRYAAAHTGRYGGSDKVNCFSAGHELLTPDGWVAVEDYQEGTPIMQWHPDGTLSFDDNPGWLVKPYNGFMYEVDAPLIACKVTPEHRFSYVRHGKLECGLVTRTIEDIYNSHGMKAVPVKGFVNTADADITDDEIRYLVALQADGSVLDTKTCIRHIFGFRRVEKINRLEMLLTNLGYKYSKYICSNTTHFRVSPAGRGAVTEKNFGKWLLTLSVRQLTIFCDELLLWDGNRNSNNGSMEYNSTNRDNVLWVDTAMRLCGRHGGVYHYDYNRRKNPACSSCWRLYERTTTYGAITTKSHIKKVVYDGLVYCPKVDSDMVLVRYGTKIFVTNQCQNLSKRSKDPMLRRSMTAGRGEVVLAVDSSQIECRVNAYLSRQEDLTALFLEGGDPYSDMGAAIFGKTYDEVYHAAKVEGSKEGKHWRAVGKQAVLSCGYGMSAATFKYRMELEGNAAAAEAANHIVNTYRMKNTYIVGFWKTCQRVLDIMYAGAHCSFGGKNGDLFYADGASVFHGVKIPSIRLPNGTYIFYQNLRKEADADGKVNYVYDQMKGRKFVPTRMWGSKLCENLCQALAFAALKWQALEIAKRGVPIHLNVHDEWVSVVPRDAAPKAMVVYYECMKKSPPYLPDGLLDCEVDAGLNYADLKTIDVGKILEAHPCRTT